MIYLNEPASTYHARPSVSAGLLHDIVKEDGCEAIAYFNSSWLNEAYVPVIDEVMQNGVAAHLAVLEKDKLEERVTIIDAPDFRTKKAQLLRDEAIGAGKIPMLYEREPGSTGPSFKKILAMRTALEESYAADLLFGNGGHNEVSYTFQIDGIPCKCRMDRFVRRSDHALILDLKTAISASPDYFQRATWTYGHHLRAAFYLAGWALQGGEAIFHPAQSYLFIVVQRDPPHIVSLFTLDESALIWGERLYFAALERFKRARDSGVWPGWMATGYPQAVSLPVWGEHRLADREAQGEL